MAKSKKPKYVFDGVRDGVYVRCWRERRELAVQVWLSGLEQGDPDGDWAMPGALGIEAAIAQAVLQTAKRK